MSLINFFDNRRFWGGKRNKFLQKIYFYRVCNRLIEVLSNLILPTYLRLTRNNPKYAIRQTDKTKDRYIVSLTSFKTRIPNLWMVAESILRNKVKPDKFILYLQLDSMDEIPKNLQEMRKRGVEIVLCSTELRSHNKYYHAIKEFPEDCIITIDDDIFYRNDLIESFVNLHLQYPNTIIANRAKSIIPQSHLYKEWPDVEIQKQDIYMLPIGVGGVLYPPHSLHKDVFDKETIKELCLTADDIWLACMSILQGTPKLFSNYKQGFLNIRIPHNTTLLDVNRERNQICVDNLNAYYKEKLGVRPFIDITIK